MGVGSKDAVPADFPKKNSGLAPKGLSILRALGPVTPAIVVSHNGPKNQNTWGFRGLCPLTLLPPFLCGKKGGAKAHLCFMAA